MLDRTRRRWRPRICGVEPVMGSSELDMESGMSPWRRKMELRRFVSAKINPSRVLIKDQLTFRHVLRNSIIPKAGDRVNITHLLSIVTYLIMTKQPIDEAQLILDYLFGLSKIGHIYHKRKKNIALGHLVAFILEKKYDLVHPVQDFEEVLYYNDGSFRAIFNKDEPRKAHVISDSEEEPAPASEPNYQDLVHRFDRLETHLDQRFYQIETYLQQQDV
ncbi:hypothetical protein MA16_Dca024209 [Dendrobium catenatum]|uniref:Uncharacterized protein n=1 Tax=Dendrobium catenatum TaxID=906689 RepID=A0A2I0VH23_9ASPA|nr:hypothetical protein MA16_Dca024209 [Dendrobium catenatum]